MQKRLYNLSRNRVFYISGLISLSVLLAFPLQEYAKKFFRKEVILPNSQIKPQTIQLDLPAEDKRIGGLIAADVNNDTKKDFIITKPGHIAVYSNSGEKLWTKQIDIQVSGQAEKQGLPGWHGSGVQAADLDGDRLTEVLFLTKDKNLHIVQGADGKTKRSIKLEPPKGASSWEHLVVANFRGKGNRDLLLQATNAKGYRKGRYLAAYAIDDLLKQENPKPLWTQDKFLGGVHAGARVADLDGDRKHEVLGGTIVGSDGKILFQVPMENTTKQHPHIDAIFVADVRPDIPGLEVVALEEGGSDRLKEGGRGIRKRFAEMYNNIAGGGNRIFLYNKERLIWETHFKHQEPQNAAVGDFDLQRPGLEIWCRSRYNTNQKPFVFDAQGKLIADYQIEDVAPKGWSDKGVEVIFTVDWTGDSRQLAAAQERHEAGDVAIFDPLNGQFLHRFDEKSDRLYVADVSGDWREELIVLNGNQLRIYQNQEPNPNPNRPRLWTQDQYRLSKMTWNYYNP
jgi:hypothetical protein